MRVSQFSIRTLVIAVALATIGLHTATKQWRVAAELRASDAQIYYRYQYDNWDDPDRYSRNNELELHSFLRFAGPDLGSTIVSVFLVGPEDPCSRCQTLFKTTKPETPRDTGLSIVG